MARKQWERKLDVQDADIRSEHAARCNIAAARHRSQALTLREFNAEIDAANMARDNRRSDMLRVLLGSTVATDE